jgi:hypothetical protein
LLQFIDAFQFWLKRNSSNGHYIHEDLHAFLRASQAQLAAFLSERKMFGANVVEKK